MLRKKNGQSRSFLTDYSCFSNLWFPSVEIFLLQSKCYDIETIIIFALENRDVSAVTKTYYKIQNSLNLCGTATCESLYMPLTVLCSTPLNCSTKLNTNDSDTFSNTKSQEYFFFPIYILITEKQNFQC